MCDSKKLNKHNIDLENADVNLKLGRVVNICRLYGTDFTDQLIP